MVLALFWWRAKNIWKKMLFLLFPAMIGKTKTKSSKAKGNASIFFIHLKLSILNRFSISENYSLILQEEKKCIYITVKRSIGEVRLVPI